MSVITQNVVRLACVKALKDADFSALDGETVEIKYTGFVDEFNRGILELMFRTKAEQAGARLVSAGRGDFELEVATLNAGNDQGRSRIPIIKRSERTEGTVHVRTTIRDAQDGRVVLTQNLRGESKYEQSKIVGIQTKGRYYVRNLQGRWERINDPQTYN